MRRRARRAPVDRARLRFRAPPARLRGTLPPLLRASLRPMAIACLRLVTLRPELLSRLPFFRRRIADATRFEADFPYLAIWTSGTSWCKARAGIGDNAASEESCAALCGEPLMRIDHEQEFASRTHDRLTEAM